MALSTLEAVPQTTEVVLDGHEVKPETSAALGAAARKIMELDEATRMMRLAVEDSSQFPSPLGINDHDRPNMIAREDTIGRYR